MNKSFIAVSNNTAPFMMTVKVTNQIDVYGRCQFELNLELRRGISLTSEQRPRLKVGGLWLNVIDKGGDAVQVSDGRLCRGYVDMSGQYPIISSFIPMSEEDRSFQEKGTRVIRIIPDKGVYVNLIDKGGLLPIKWITRCKTTGEMLCLLQAGQSLRFEQRGGSQTYLHNLSMGGIEETSSMSLLVTRGGTPEKVIKSLIKADELYAQRLDRREELLRQEGGATGWIAAFAAALNLNIDEVDEVHENEQCVA